MVRIFIHSRDLRVEDNRGLALALMGPTLAIFVINPEQVPPQNRYFSPKAFSFLIESLLELKARYQSLGSDLVCFYGDRLSAIRVLSSIFQIEKVVTNADYTPYAKARDARFPVETTWDYTLIDLASIGPKSGGIGAYQVFKPFYDSMITRRIDLTQANLANLIPRSQLADIPNQLSIENLRSFISERSVIPPGRNAALQILFNRIPPQYTTNHVYPSNPTSYLSAHIKFGTVSIREVFLTGVNQQGLNSEFVRQVIWHDFYAGLMNALPPDRTLGNGNFRQLNINWPYGPEAEAYFTRWTQGQTGVPLVDAGMRQLNATGWMHNRGRLAVSNYLVFGLGLNWKWGEWYFATHLVDYDPSSNNGNWQWSAGVGIDRPRSWPRAYSLENQSKEYDPQCLYIKTYIPELGNVPNRDIHNWQIAHGSYPGVYLSPIVDYNTNRDRLVAIYKSLV